MRQGHDVEVLTGFPNYPVGKIYPGYSLRLYQREELDGVRITRVPLYPSHDSGGLRRMLTYLSFSCSATLLGPLLVKKPDVIYVYHGGNATVGFSAWFIGMVLKVPFVLDIQDLWPDTVTSSGMLPRWLQWLVPALAAWCRFMYRQAAGIAVLSPGFKRALTSRGVPADKVVVIPNWCPETQIRPNTLPPGESARLENRFNIVIAGNMGKMQGLEVVIETAASLQSREPRLQFVLVGGGVDRPHLEQRVATLGLTNLCFLPRRPVAEIGSLLYNADAFLLHLKDDPLFAITIPSRLQAYLAVGRPILCGVRGDGADLVQKAGAGLCFEPEDPKSLEEAVMLLLRLAPEYRLEMGKRGQNFYREFLSLQVGTRAFLDLFIRAQKGVPLQGPSVI